MLGPTIPDPTMELDGLKIVKTVVADSPYKLFVGGLPCDWTEDQVRTSLHGGKEREGRERRGEGEEASFL
jgi:hypothetical protein